MMWRDGLRLPSRSLGEGWCRPIIYLGTRQSASLQAEIVKPCLRNCSAVSTFMNPKIICLLAVFSLAFSGALFAAGGKTYQVTGTVVEVTPSMIALQKGAERMEFGIDPTTKLSGEVKVGEKITITYAMSAMKVEGATPSSSKEESKASPTP